MLTNEAKYNIRGLAYALQQTYKEKLSKCSLKCLNEKELIKVIETNENDFQEKLMEAFLILDNAKITEIQIVNNNSIITNIPIK